MKSAIIYYSKHHENTKKLLTAIAEKHSVDLIDVLEAASTDLCKYDMIGFASGIYYSKFHKSLLKFAEQSLPCGKPVFFLYTYGAKKEGYTKAISEIAVAKGATILGEYGCLGFNTFGPFKLIGGIAKGHHDKTELQDAAEFYGSLADRS